MVGPVIDVFAAPYELWSTRKTSIEETLALMENHGLSLGKASEIKERLLRSIATHTEAAAYMLEARVDNALENHVDAELRKSAALKELRAFMPSVTPVPLRAYQNEFPAVDMAHVDSIINTYGVTLAEGQMLFHGGACPSSVQSQVTIRPFSTSFCPQVALRNAEWRGKAYEAGRIELMVVRVTDARTKAFVYGAKGSKGHEKEVVFASGARMTQTGRQHICDMVVSRVDANYRTVDKVVPAYVVRVDLS